MTLRLERGPELKALTVPFTALPPGLIPRKVGILLGPRSPAAVLLRRGRPLTHLQVLLTELT